MDSQYMCFRVVRGGAAQPRFFFRGIFPERKKGSEHRPNVRPIALQQY